MKILSFDTSNPAVSVALMAGGRVIAVKQVLPSQSGRQEAVSQLMPSIDAVTKDCRWRRNDIDLIVVGVGPGSFTGMRTSVVTARTLAQSLNIALIGVDSLRCAAAGLELPATVVLSGGRGHYFVATYESGVEGKTRWEPGDAPMKSVLQPCCLTGEDFVNALSKAGSCFVEEKILDEVGRIKPSCRSLDVNPHVAVVQAQLAISEIGANDTDRDKLRSMYRYDTVNPLYLRGASITMKAPQA